MVTMGDCKHYKNLVEEVRTPTFLLKLEERYDSMAVLSGLAVLGVFVVCVSSPPPNTFL